MKEAMREKMVVTSSLSCLCFFGLDLLVEALRELMLRTFEQINNEKKEIMSKKETITVHAVLASSQGAHTSSQGSLVRG